MVFAVEFSDSDHICKQNQWRSLRFGSVKKGLVLSGSKGGVPWQFEAGKLWQIVLFFHQTPAIFKFDAGMKLGPFFMLFVFMYSFWVIDLYFKDWVFGVTSTLGWVI